LAHFRDRLAPKFRDALHIGLRHPHVPRFARAAVAAPRALKAQTGLIPRIIHCISSLIIEQANVAAFLFPVQRDRLHHYPDVE
jgi:hypothetical protein